MTALLVVQRNTGQKSAQTSTRSQGSKSVNVTLSNNDAASGYGNLFTILSVCQSTDWWVNTGANIHVCADVSLFSSYQVARDCSVLMGNGSHASIHGVGMVDLKFTSGKIVQLKNVQHVPAIKKKAAPRVRIAPDRPGGPNQAMSEGNMP